MAGRTRTNIEQPGRNYCGQNITYILSCIHPNFKLSSYVPNHTFSGLDITRNQLRDARSGKCITSDTLLQLSRSFSLYLKEEEKNISKEDLTLPPAEFKEKFPETDFQYDLSSSRTVVQNYVANRLYRGYYLFQESPVVNQAYFKLFYNKTTGTYSAVMLRGIKDYKDDSVQALRNCIEDETQNLQWIMEQFDRIITKSSEKSSLHLYVAENSQIRVTPNCIQITFLSHEKNPRYSTLFWDVQVISKSALKTYEGGVALCVNTNDGRGNNICCFKMGLELVTPDSPLKKASHTAPEELPPLENTAPRLMQELKADLSDGIFVLQHDTRWYYYMKDVQNHKKKGTVLENGAAELEAALERVKKMEEDYQRKMKELEELIGQMGQKDNQES